MTAHALEATTYVFSELFYVGWTDQDIAREPGGRSIVAIRAALSTGTLPRDLAARAEEILRASFQDRRDDADEAEGSLIDRAISECMDAQGCPRPGRPEVTTTPTAEQGARPAPDGTDIDAVIDRMRERGAHVAVERGPDGEVSRLRVIGGAPSIDAHWMGPSYAAGRMRAWLEAHGNTPPLAGDIQEALGRWHGPWTVLGMADEDGTDPRDLRPAAPWGGGADPWIRHGWPYVIVTPEEGEGGMPRSHVATGIASRPAADMMAAAPEMLAALRALVERMERSGRAHDDALDGELVDRARDAIARAEGRHRRNTPA